MNQKIKTLKIIHFAICAGTFFAYLFIGNISMETLKIPTIDSDSIIFLLVPILAFVASNFLFKSQLEKVDKKLKTEDKFTLYQAASIIRWAVLEAAAFLLLIAKPDFVLLGIILIVYLAYLRPTEERIKKDLEN